MITCVCLFLLQSDADLQMQQETSVVNWDEVYPEQKYIFGDFTERLWAYLTIRQLLENRFAHLSRLSSLCVPPLVH